TLYRQNGSTIAGETPELEKIKDYKIQVNKPLTFAGFGVYQVDYLLNQLTKMSFKLQNKSTEKSFGKFTVNLDAPKNTYQLEDGYKVELLSYFPDFYFNEENEPDTKTSLPNNPAFVFKMFTPDHPKGEVAFVGIRTNIEPFSRGENKYKLTFSGLDTTDLSALTVHKDKTLWIIITG